ncbi:MAG: ChaN family lipoprotein [Pseudomonadota bacterium]
MARIKGCLTIVLLTFASLVHAQNMLYTDHPLAGKIWDMHSNSFIDEATLIARINLSNVLLLGEVHDNSQHHELQQKLLQARIDSGAKPALMMEQLDAASQPILDQALAGVKSDEVLNNVTALIKFSDWQFYSPLLAVAVNNRLPIIAANVPNQFLQPVIWKGYAAYDAAELKRLDVEAVWNERRQKYLASSMGGAHCGQLRDELRLGLTRSQRLRDALMADSAISSISRGVVGIVGSSHARRDIGLPLYFAARDPSARVFSIGFVEVTDSTDPRAYNADSATGEAPFDVMWFTPRMEREDPCTNFVKPKEPRPSPRESDPYLTGVPDNR